MSGSRSTSVRGAAIYEFDDSFSDGGFMVDLQSSYTREDAVADGVLFDVSEAARAVDIFVPVYMTAGLWKSRFIECRMERACIVLNLGPLRGQINRRAFGKPLAPIVHKSFDEPFTVRFHIDPSDEFGVVVTAAFMAEKVAYDMPRTGAGGSFFVV
ncbi:MAG: DUF6573 family protein [Acidimicrobiales bacterium]